MGAKASRLVSTMPATPYSGAMGSFSRNSYRSSLMPLGSRMATPAATITNKSSRPTAAATSSLRVMRPYSAMPVMAISGTGDRMNSATASAMNLWQRPLSSR